MKSIRTLFVTCILFFLSILPAYAHISVKPDTVTIASYQSFTVSVPVEKDIPTTEVRLLIPDSLSNVTPNVKPGWKIETKKANIDGEEKLTEIIWTGGSIPDGQRDEFIFSAKTPATEGVLVWKIYQIYSGGSVVSWDIENEEGNEDDENRGPASRTQVTSKSVMNTSGSISLILSVLALLGVIFIIFILKTKRSS